MTNAVVTRPCDVYGMGMAVYEVSPRDPFVLLLHLISARVLARDIPFREYTDSADLTEIRNGKRPRKPANAASLGISGCCWNSVGIRGRSAAPTYPMVRTYSPRRPSLRILGCGPHAIQTEDERYHHQPGLTMKRNIDSYITLRYGSHVHTTSHATTIGGNKYIWYGIPFI